MAAGQETLRTERRLDALSSTRDTSVTIKVEAELVEERVGARRRRRDSLDVGGSARVTAAEVLMEF